MSTITVKELAAPTGYDLKIAAGETLDLKSQGTVTMPTGSILQVVQATSNTGITVTANTYTTIGSNVVITPSSASSKVLVQLTAGSMAYNAGDIAMRITRNGTEIMVQGRQAYTNANEWVGNPVKLMYLDSPNSTSAVTYSFECKVSGNQIEFNSTGGSTSNVNGAVSIAMEVQG
jgi:hypothetical protein